VSLPEVPEKLRGRVRPRRSLPPFVNAPTEKSAQRELVLIAKAYVKEKPGYDHAAPRKVFANGLDVGEEAALKKLRRAAHELLLAPTLDGVKSAPIEVLAVAERMAHHAIHDATIATPVGFARGAADAVEVMARSLDLDIEGQNYTKCVYVVRNEGEEPGRWVADWLPLRHVVCAQGDAEYARARKVAKAFRAKLSPVKAARLAYAFPDEPWSVEDVRAYMKAPPERSYHYVDLLGACDDVSVARHFLEDVAANAFDYAMNLPAKDALALFADALPPLLVKPKYGPLLKSPPRELAEAIALFRDAKAAEILAAYVGHAILGPIVAAYFQDNPTLRGVLDGVAKGKSKAASAAQHLLASGDKRADGPVANDADVPRVLRERPWRPRHEAAATAVLAIAIAQNIEERIELSDSERELRFEAENVVRDMTQDELEKWRMELAAGKFTWVNYVTHYVKHSVEYLRVPKDEVLRAWNEGDASVEGTHVEFLAVHGVAAIPGYVKRDWVHGLAYTEVDDEPMLEVLARIVSPRIAGIMARVNARRKNFRKPALAWMLRHPEVAALGLVPDALGKPGEARDDAELALRWMPQKGARAPVMAAARTYGDPAHDAIEALLARDPLALDVTAPKPPSFLRRGDLPGVRLKASRLRSDGNAGTRLPDDAMDALLEMLRVAPLDPPYAGVSAVAEACDEASLGELSLELVEQWVLAGSPGRFEWMLFAAALFPSEAGTRRVAQLAREWARRDRKKALRACTVLATLGQRQGGDLPLLHLGHIAATSRFDDLRDAARGLLDEVAAARGLTRAELEDRIVPDLDLDEGGTLELSFGKRRFVVALDEGLRPFVQGEKALESPSLPRATKEDDAVMAKAAKARFDVLKADASATADRQIRRFEEAMVTRRTWSTADFLQYVASHRLLVHLARRLVWEALPSHETFRVAEDGTFASASDAVLALGEGEVRVAHPATLGDEVTRRWATVFGDYRIAQPFEQLARVVSVPSAAQRGSKRIVLTIEARATKVLGTLESRGWRRNDRGHVTAYLRPLLGGGEAKLSLDPGISMEDVKDAGVQKVEGVDLPVPCEAMDPIDFTEIRRDLEALR